MNKLLNLLYSALIALIALIALYGLANAPTLTWCIIAIFFALGLICYVWEGLSKLITKLTGSKAKD